MLRAGKNGMRGIVATDPRQGVSEEEEEEEEKRRRRRKRKRRKIIKFKIKVRPYLGLMAAVKSLSGCFPVTIDVQASI